MASLITRIENAFLGALAADLNRDRPLPMFSGVDPADLFPNPPKAALYEEILYARRHAPRGTRERSLADSVIDGATWDPLLAGLTPEYLRWLIEEACPDVGNIDAYARRLRSAAIRRDRASWALGPWTDPGEDREAVRERMLTDAVRREARLHADLIPDPEVAPGNAFTRLPPPIDPSEPPTDLARVTDDMLLAELLHDPGAIPAVAGVLPSEYFTDPQRRDTFHALVTLAETGPDLVDPLLVAWQITEHRAAEAGPAPAHEDSRGDADLGYLQRLTMLPPAPADALNMACTGVAERIVSLPDSSPVLPSRRAPTVPSTSSNPRRLVRAVPAARSTPAVLDPRLRPPPPPGPAPGLGPRR